MKTGKVRHKYLMGHAAFLLLILVLSGVIVWEKWRPVIAPGTIDRTTLTPRRHEGVWGYVNDRDQWAILPGYAEARPFIEDRACVRVGRGWGWIDRYGKCVVPFQYSGVSDKPREGLVHVMKDGMWGYTTVRGEPVVDTIYGRAEPFQDGWGRVAKNRKWGCIDRDGNIVLPLVYDTVLPLENGVPWDGRPGYIDTKGNTVMSVTPGSQRGEQPELAGVQQNGLWGFVDRNGQQVVPCQFLEIVPFIGRQPHTPVLLAGGWALIDRTGAVVVEPEFMGPSRERIASMLPIAWAGDPCEGLIPVNVGGHIIRWPWKGDFFACLGGKWGYVTRRWEWVVEPRFERPGLFDRGVADVVLDGKLVHIDQRGWVLTDDEAAAILEAAAQYEYLIGVIRDSDPVYRALKYVEDSERRRAAAVRNEMRAREQQRQRAMQRR